MKKFAIYISLLLIAIIMADTSTIEKIGFSSAKRRIFDDYMRMVAVSNTGDSLLSVPPDSVRLFIATQISDSIQALDHRTLARLDSFSLAKTAELNDSINAVESRMTVDLSDSTQAAIDSARTVLINSKAYTNAREVAITTAYKAAIRDSLNRIETMVADSSQAYLDSLRTAKTDLKYYTTKSINDTTRASEHRELTRFDSINTVLRLAMIDSSKAVWDDSTHAATVIIPNDLRVHSEITVDDTLHIGAASLIDGSGDLILYNTNFNVVDHNIATNKELSVTDTTRINNAKLINKGASNIVQIIAPANKTGQVHLDGAEVQVTQNNLTFGNAASITNPSSGIISVNTTTLSVPTDSAYIANILRTDTLRTKKILYDTDIIRIQLPDTISAVVGDTLQIFYRGIIEAQDPYAYSMRLYSTKGEALNRYYRYCPVAADTTGTHVFRLRLYNEAMVELAGDSVVIKAQKAWQPTVNNIMPIGDSFTDANYYWVNEFYRRLTGTGGTPAGNAFTGLATIGNKGVAPNQRIGYSGKTWSWYANATTPSATALKYMWFFGTHDKAIADVGSLWSDGTNQWTLDSLYTGRVAFTKTGHIVNPPASGTLTHVSGATHTADITYTTIEAIDGNPLWDYNDNEIDFLAYCTRNSFADVDVLIPLLTWNGLSAYQDEASDHATLIADCKDVIDSLHSQYPNAHVMLCPPSMPPVWNGMAITYGADSSYGNYYGMVTTIIGLNKAYQALSKEAEYTGWVHYVNTTMQFDSEYGFATTTLKPNLRYVGTMREVATSNGVHPNTQGYYMIADAIYREFVRLFCK